MKGLLAGSLLALGVLAQAPAQRTVVFVCEHGSAKSVVAAAHFNRLAKQRGLNLIAIAKGTVPDAAFAPPALAGLAADGLAPSGDAPRKLEMADVEAADRVIVFNDLPASFTSLKVEKWEVPPVSTAYAASRDAMLVRIEQLLESLSTGRPRAESPLSSPQDGLGDPPELEQIARPPA